METLEGGAWGGRKKRKRKAEVRRRAAARDKEGRRRPDKEHRGGQVDERGEGGEARRDQGGVQRQWILSEKGRGRSEEMEAESRDSAACSVGGARRGADVEIRNTAGVKLMRRRRGKEGGGRRGIASRREPNGKGNFEMRGKGG